MAGGSASALSLSRPAQASLTLRPAGSLSRPKATFVTRLQPMRLPAQAARQLPDQSTTLRVDSSSTDDSRLRGALPGTDIWHRSKFSENSAPRRRKRAAWITRSRPDEHCPRRTRSIRWDESIRNFDANFAIEADRTRMERQVGQCWVILSRSEQFYTDVLKY